MRITKKWIATGGHDGYWLVSNGSYKISCDDSELEETVEELTVTSE